MRKYKNDGKLKIPKRRKSAKKSEEDIEIIEECFCHNGHNLISNRVKFNECNGIYLKIKDKEKQGYVGISPICGCKMRISIDVDLTEGETFEFFCPECDEKLLVYSPCPSCEGEMITLFLNKEADYTHCLGICNSVGCPQAEVRMGDEIRSCLRKQYHDETHR